MPLVGHSAPLKATLNDPPLSVSAFLNQNTPGPPPNTVSGHGTEARAKVGRCGSDRAPAKQAHGYGFHS